MRWVAASNYKPLYLGKDWQTQERSRQTPRESCHSCGFRQGIKPGEWNGPMCMLTIPFWTMSRCRESSGSLMDSAWHSAWTSKKEGLNWITVTAAFSGISLLMEEEGNNSMQPCGTDLIWESKDSRPLSHTQPCMCMNTCHLLVWNTVFFSNTNLLQIVVYKVIILFENSHPNRASISSFITN